MTAEGAIIQSPQWLRSPAGQYLLAWEQRHLDQAVADLFGFHALQLGLPQLAALRANRMPHRWLAVESAGGDGPASVAAADAAATSAEATGGAPGERAAVIAAPTLRCHFDALPFDAASLDLVVLPHALELARDPHLALREVERVLVPEGRAITSASTRRACGGRPEARPAAPKPRAGRRRAVPAPCRRVHRLRRLRDWLRLLSFEVEAGRFGCYVPPVTSARWVSRFAWMERAGDHWWPVFGALYYIVAVKRVRGMRLVGLIKNEARVKAAVTAPAPVARDSAPARRPA